MKMKPFYGYQDRVQQNNQILYYEAHQDPSVVTSVEIIEPGLGHKFTGDFYGLLDKLAVPPNLFLISLYLNQLTSPYQYDGKLLEIVIAKPVNRLR